MRKTFHQQALQPLVDEQDRGNHVTARAMAAAVRMELPPLHIGQHILAQLSVPIGPGGAHWTEDHYWSIAPVEIEFHDVLVHGAAGIVFAGDGLVLETLHQVQAQDEGIALHPDGSVVADLADDIVDLPGRHLSLLTGSAANYYHWNMDGLGRLATQDLDGLGCDSVLHPEFSLDFQRDSFRRVGLKLPTRPVARGTTLRVEHLVVPWSVVGLHVPHPVLRTVFQRVAQNPPVAQAPGLYPQRLYIDRRGSVNRPLRNETQVIAALAQVGFVAVRLETFGLSAQIALFANAEIVVAPHGAGLANMVYAGERTRLVELHMDSWVNWCFRRLAAVGCNYYDCVIGLEDHPGSAALPDWPHDTSWTVSITHVLAAVERALAE